MTPENGRIYVGDCLEVMRNWPNTCVQSCITSPPYWGLRDYGVAGQLGLEKTPQEYVDKLVAVFREVRRVLLDDGTLWLNLGDSSSEKELQGIPRRVAIALQSDGWHLRSDIIWSKPKCMPESIKDRPTRSHEYIFLLSKSLRYYYDAAAIAEPALYPVASGMDDNGFKDVKQYNGKHGQRTDKQRGHSRRHAGFHDRWDKMEKSEQCSGMRNKRDVWTVVPSNFPEAHFATFPIGLISPCVLAGAPRGGVVLDPFIGAGTTAVASLTYSRDFIGIELNQEYAAMAEKRIALERAQLKMF